MFLSEEKEDIIPFEFFGAVKNQREVTGTLTITNYPLKEDGRMRKQYNYIIEL